MKRIRRWISASVLGAALATFGLAAPAAAMSASLPAESVSMQEADAPVIVLIIVYDENGNVICVLPVEA